MRLSWHGLLRPQGADACRVAGCTMVSCCIEIEGSAYSVAMTEAGIMAARDRCGTAPRLPGFVTEMAPQRPAPESLEFEARWTSDWSSRP
jgi:hypothetical protein